MATEGQLKDAVGASWAVIAAENEVEGKIICKLLSEVRSRASRRHSEAEGRGSVVADPNALGSNDVEGEVGETKPATGMETVSDKKSERTQQGGSREGGGDLGLVSHIQSKVARLFHAHNGKCLRWHLREQEGGATNLAYIHFIGAWEKAR